jgi:microcin C transport system substrate-binding protein
MTDKREAGHGPNIMTWTRRDLGRLAAGVGAIAAMPTAVSLGGATTVAHGVSAFGDLKYPAGFGHFDYADPDALVGGTFSTGVGGGTFDSLNPFILKGNPATGVGLTFDSLMVSAGDEPDAMYGLIASSVEYPADRLWATFEIRPEARFSDGSPITAEDVVFTFKTLREQGRPTYRVVLSAITAVTAESPLRVRFDFHPDAPRRDLPMTVASIGILSKAYYATTDFNQSTLDPPLGSGPYMVEIEDLEPGRTIVYRRRDDYWGWHLPVNRGRWNFGHFRYEYFRDRSAGFEAFKNGTFTFTEEFWSKLWATAYDFPAIQRGDVIRDVLQDNNPSGAQGYWFNLRRKKFQDPRVRQALSLAFDFEWSNKTLFYGLYARTDSFFEGGPMQAEGKPTPGELALLEPLADKLPPGVLDQPAYSPVPTDGSGRNRAALRAAGKLLDQAGWEVIDGIRQKDGERLEFEFLLVGEGFERITVPYVRNLERIGAKGTVRTIDPSQYNRRMDEFDFDITVSRKSMQLTPGVELKDYFHSRSANSPGSSNTAGLADPAVDALIDVIERTADRVLLTDAVKALDRVMRAMHIWVPQWHKGSHTIAYWDIYARPGLKPEYQRGVDDLWWIDPDKHARLKDQVGG